MSYMGGLKRVTTRKNYLSLTRLLLALLGEFVWLVHVALIKIAPGLLKNQDKISAGGAPNSKPQP